MNSNIQTDLKAWNVRYHARNKTYFFDLRDEYKFKPETYMHVIAHVAGESPLIAINQASEPSNPVLRGDAMTEFLSISSIIQKHQFELTSAGS